MARIESPCTCQRLLRHAARFFRSSNGDVDLLLLASLPQLFQD